MEQQRKLDLKDLLAGPFAGYGGLTLLARRMEVSRHAVYQWRTDRRAPNVSNRLGLQLLVETHAEPWSD